MNTFSKKTAPKKFFDHNSCLNESDLISSVCPPKSTIPHRSERSEHDLIFFTLICSPCEPSFKATPFVVMIIPNLIAFMVTVSLRHTTQMSRSSIISPKRRFFFAFSLLVEDNFSNLKYEAWQSLLLKQFSKIISSSKNFLRFLKFKIAFRLSFYTAFSSIGVR